MTRIIGLLIIVGSGIVTGTGARGSIVVTAGAGDCGLCFGALPELPVAAA